jgi:ribosome-binding protein aMBF1 (putative translation factor)
MICEMCGCHDRVTRTIRKADSVTRLRRCINCGHTIKTVEQKEVSQPKPERKPQRKKKAAPPKKSDAAIPEAKGALAQALQAAE